jgi:hypothetical protein
MHFGEFAGRVLVLGGLTGALQTHDACMILEQEFGQEPEIVRREIG